MNKKEIATFYTFMGATSKAIENINADIKDIKDNHLKHIDKKLNGLLFSVLAGVIVAIFTIAWQMISK